MANPAETADISILCAKNIPVGVGRFDSNTTFQKGLRDDEHYPPARHQRKKTWLQPKSNPRTDREFMSTFLTSAAEAESCDENIVEKLLEQNVSYRDLAALVAEDMELMGLTNRKHCAELLDMFALLPNQDPTYDSICKLPEAQEYNSEIFSQATDHLETMRSVLIAANYKLQLMPPTDVIVGEKSFASRFVLDALRELRGATDEVEKELDELGLLITNSQMQRKQRHSSGFYGTLNTLLLTSLLSGTLAALWFWKLHK